MRYVPWDGVSIRGVLRTSESLRYYDIDGVGNDKIRHLIGQKRLKQDGHTLAPANVVCVRFTLAVIRVEPVGKASFV